MSERQHSSSPLRDSRMWRDRTRLDTQLTSSGREQAAALNVATIGTVQTEVELIVTSPLRRTLQTTLDGLPEAIRRLGKSNIVLLPQAIETSNRERRLGARLWLPASADERPAIGPAPPCWAEPVDTGCPADVLESTPEFQGCQSFSVLSVTFDSILRHWLPVNFGPLTEIPDWRDRTNGPFPAEREAIRERARYVRRWLRARPEQCIVLVTHGNFLQTLVHGRFIGKEVEFANAEVRKYTFAEIGEQEKDAWLVLQEKEVAVGEKLATSPELSERDPPMP